jgi:hypothetical protein
VRFIDYNASTLMKLAWKLSVGRRLTRRAMVVRDSLRVGALAVALAGCSKAPLATGPAAGAVSAVPAATALASSSSTPNDAAPDPGRIATIVNRHVELTGGPSAAEIAAVRIHDGRVTVTGGLDEKTVKQIVKGSYSDFRTCHAHAPPGSVGRVSLKLTVDASGAVSEARDVGSDVPLISSACVVKVASVLAFPAPKDGPATILYTLLFNLD